MTAKRKAPVNVVMPEVKLTVADLAYMTGLLPGGVRCMPARHVTDKLIFLGLIHMAEVAPCPKAVAEYGKTEADNKALIKAAIKDDQWDTVYRIADDWRYARMRKPKPEKALILTKPGLELMAKGRAKTITANGGGCVK